MPTSIKALAVNHGPHAHESARPVDNWLTGNGWWRVSDRNADEVRYLIQHDGQKVIEVGRVVSWVPSAPRHVAAEPRLAGRKHFNCDPNVPVEVEALIGTPWSRPSRNPVQIVTIDLPLEPQ